MATTKGPYLQTGKYERRGNEKLAWTRYHGVVVKHNLKLIPVPGIS